MKIYRNGVLEASKPGMVPFIPANDDLMLGYSSLDPFGLSLDEVSIYNRALSAAEVEAIYAAGSACRCGFQRRILSFNKASIIPAMLPTMFYRLVKP